MKLIANTFFVAILWKRYKRLIVAVCLLVLSYLLVSLLHKDFLSYVDNSGKDQYLALSYAIKWATLLLCTLGFYLLISYKKKSNSSKNKKLSPPTNVEAPPDRPDPFENIRHKKKLRGKADHLLDD